MITGLPPETLIKELSVSGTADTDDLTPPSGMRIRVLGFVVCGTVFTSLTSSERGTLAFGTGGVLDATKVLCSYRHITTFNPLCIARQMINVVGAIDEVVRLTNVTYTLGSIDSSAVVYYRLE